MAIVDLLGPPIAYHRVYRTITRSTVAAVFISQLTYWQHVVDKGGGGVDGWIYKTIAEFEEETGLSRSEQATARKVLGGKNIIEEKKAGMPRKMYYRVNWQVLEDLLQQYQRSTDFRIHECKDQSGMCAAIKRTTYSSTETTTHTTTTAGTGGNDIEKYIYEAINAARPKDPIAFRISLKRRLRTQGGLSDLDKQQLKLWTISSTEPVVINAGDSITWRGANRRVTAVYDATLEIEGIGMQPKGVVYAALTDNSAILLKNEHNYV
jgi:hypothetical protein